jgi:hypothetical protein
MSACSYGKTKFGFSVLRGVRAGPFQSTVGCVLCEARMMVVNGEAVAAFTVGGEIVAIVCDGCLDPRSRDHLAALRSTTATMKEAHR